MAQPSRHPRESETVFTELMMPHHANILGNVFGGHILALVDRVAAVAAIRHAHRECVTVSVDKVDFREPIHVGELVTAKARVNFAGRTSMEVGVKVLAENVLTGDIRHTNSCYVTYVALDENADTFKVEMTLAQANEKDFDALMLPGGVINADAIRIDKKAQQFAQEIDRSGKPIAVICHGAWLLVSAGLVNERHITSWPTLKDDLECAGGRWESAAKTLPRSIRWCL